MAPKSKTKKRANTQKKNYNKERQKNVKESGAIQDEIILVITLVVSILLFLSNFDLSGKVGKYVSGFTFGVIGVEAYILPFIIFFLTAFHLSNVGSKKAGRKIISVIVFFVALSALLQLISMGSYDGTIKIYEYYTISSKERIGGGILGGIQVMILCGLFEEVATYIILISVMLISFIVISGKAIFTYIAGKSKVSYEERKEYQRLRREEQEELERRMPAHDQGRRPPKTFILDPSIQTAGPTAKGKSTENAAVVSMNDRKARKGQKVENTEKPSFNFHTLFEGHAHNVTEKSNQSLEQTGPIPLYEEELRNKFGTDSMDFEEEPVVIDTSTPYIKTPEIENISFSDPVEPVPDKTTDVVPPEQHSIKQQEKITKSTTEVENIEIDQTSKQKEYIFPPTNLLAAPKMKSNKGVSPERELKETAMKLQNTLESFGVHVTITNVSCGPAVTRYELQPEQGVKVSRITALADDIKLNLAAADIRIEAPIPGKAAVGIEVPNKENSMVAFRELIESREFTGHPSDIAFAVGKDIGGQTIITDIAKMPHLLIAGATGSGKSVCINTLVMSILYKAKPSDVRLIMVDPKVVELSVYNGIPHLLIPVVTDPKKASAALNWAVMEMTERYKKFADAGVRDLKGYNEKVAQVAHLNDESCQKLPQIVIIIDELADLMMVAPGEVEDAICRLAQMARAAGLHLIIATQRPSVNVITGLIKANIPSRIAFAVSSAIDSRTILDGSGAEKLLGKGDMLFFPSGYPKPVRIQGAFISDKEVSSVVEFLKKNNNEAQYSDDIHEKINNAKPGETSLSGGDDRDEYFAEAGKFIIEKDKASIGMLQRVYKIGFNRAARIMDQLAEAGVVGPEEGTKPRKVLMTQEEFEQYLEEY